MNKLEFNQQIDALLDKVNSIPFDDYSAAISAINEFSRFAGANHKYLLNQYVTEHIGGIKAAFEQMKSAKSYHDKSQHYMRGVRNLVNDITIMKQNSVPLQTE